MKDRGDDSLSRASHQLIIDDFQAMRTMRRDFVKFMGVTKIDTASHGKDAINLLGLAPYDIVICDCNLGAGQNGQQILEDAKLRNLIGIRSRSRCHRWFETARDLDEKHLILSQVFHQESTGWPNQAI